MSVRCGLRDGGGVPALAAAAWVESHANNLDRGDRDSVGAFQQRPSQGRCDPASLCQDVDHATRKFLDQAVRRNDAHPNRYADSNVTFSYFA